MKVVRSVTGLIILLIILFSLGTNFSACKKQVINDTIIIKDTIRTTDTLHVIDSANCSCYDLTDGLIAYYNFNGGNLNDSSGNKNNIIFNNAVKTTDRFGRANNAYLFNGKDSHMEVASSSSLSPNGAISLMAIVKMNGFYLGACHGNQIFQKGTGDSRPGVYGMRTSDNGDCAAPADTSKERWIGYYGDNATTGSSTVAGATDTSAYIGTGRWMTLVMTYDGQESRAYVDGKLKGVYKRTAVFTPSADNLSIGHLADSQYPYFFNGAIDEIRIYNKALCPGAVKQLSSITD